MVVVAVVAAVALVLTVVLQARCISAVGRVVCRRDELESAVDQRADVVAAALRAAGLAADESLSAALSRPSVRAAVESVADLPVADAHEAHMLLIDATNGLCCANAPARRVAIAPTSLVDLGHLSSEGRVQAIDLGGHAPAPRMLAEVHRKVAAGGGHVSYGADTASGRRRWHAYFAQVPGMRVYLGAASES